MKWIIGLTALLCAACSQQTPTPDARQGNGRHGELTLTRVEVIGVDLAAPVEALDAAGEARTWNEAVMVRLSLDGVPTTSLQLQLYVGDHRIREHGSWEGGLYFWVYDPALVSRLNGQEISYTYDRGERRSLGRKLNTISIKDPVAEDSLFPGRKRQ